MARTSRFLVSSSHLSFASTSLTFSSTDQIKYEHDRAVNRVVFGGQSGSWLMSGGQDGQMKLWVHSSSLQECANALLTLPATGHPRTSTRLAHSQSLLPRPPSCLLPLRRSTLHSRRRLRLRYPHPLRHPLHRPTRRRRYRPNSRARRQLLGDGLEGQHRRGKE